MTGDWPALRAMLIQPWLLRSTQAAPWVNGILLAMMALSAPFILAASGKGKALALLVFGIALAMFLLVWWTLLIESMGKQSTPSAMRLIPRFRQRARHVLLAACVLAALLLTAAVGVPVGYPAHVFVAAGLALVEISLLKTGRNKWLLIALLLAMSLAPEALRGTVVQALLADAVVLPGLIVLALRGRYALNCVLSENSDAPARTVARLAPPVRWSPMRLPLHAVSRLLWPHPFTGFLALTASILAIVAVMRLHFGGNTYEAMGAMRGVFVFMIMSKQPYLVRDLIASGYQRQGEQSLVRLAAHSPSVTELNEILGRDVLILGVGGWLWLALWPCAFMLIFGASLADALSVFAVSTCCLPLTACVLRDYARDSAERALPTPYAGALLVLLLLLAGFASNFHWSPVASFALMAVAVTLALAIGASRWRRMLAAPPAFPAGRLP